jgi:hypothetical protein
MNTHQSYIICMHRTVHVVSHPLCWCCCFPSSYYFFISLLLFLYTVLKNKPRASFTGGKAGWLVFYSYNTVETSVLVCLYLYIHIMVHVLCCTLCVVTSRSYNAFSSLCCCCCNPKISCILKLINITSTSTYWATINQVVSIAL